MVNPGELHVSRLYADDSDLTHFDNRTMAWRSVESSGGVTAFTELFPATHLGFLRMQASYRSDWHPAPRKQYVMVLQGTMEVEAGDGERRTFEPGSVLLVTDTAGRGHRTRVIGDDDVFLVWVPVP